MKKNRKEIQVEWGDCDPAGIVYYPRFFEMFDSCTNALFESVGFKKQEVLKAYGLAGIPTIRVFEALACGIPLVCSPWSDEEHLFHPGEDYLLVNDGKQMKAELERLLRDEKARRQLGAQGMKTIRERHTCAHRAQQLISICEEIAA